MSQDFRTKLCSIKVDEGGLDWWWDGERFTQDELQRVEYQDGTLAEADLEKARKAVTPLEARLVPIGP